MQIEIILTEVDLRALVKAELERKLGDVKLENSDIKIEVKSSQNYKSEWETAQFRARLHVLR